MKKVLVRECGLSVIGEIEEDLIESYIALTVPQGSRILIGDSLDDILNQIKVNLKGQPVIDLECNNREGYKAAVEREKACAVEKTNRINAL